MLQSGRKISGAAPLRGGDGAKGASERSWRQRSRANRADNGVAARRVSCAALVVVTGITRYVVHHAGVCVMGAIVIGAWVIGAIVIGAIVIGARGSLLRSGHH